MSNAEYFNLDIYNGFMFEINAVCLNFLIITIMLENNNISCFPQKH